MQPIFAAPTPDAIPLIAVYSDDLEATIANLPNAAADWLRGMGFDASIGACAVLPNSDGSINYMPNAEFSGTDTFTYTAQGSAGEEETAAMLSPVM